MLKALGDITAHTYGNALLRQGAETPLFDGLGSRRTGTDAAGAVTGGQTADAFGRPVTSDGAGGGAYAFGATSGYRAEGDGAMFIDAGLVKVGCRYYDPQVGRFITRDTVLTEKPYAYCDGDPVNATDPSGHMSLVKGILGGPGTAIALAIAFHSEVGYITSPPGNGGSSELTNGAEMNGVANIIGGVGAIAVGVGLTGSTSVGIALGGAVLVTGGMLVLGVGAAIAIVSVGRYEHWW